jgi:branched-chain amino acid transport system permease protein
MPTRALVTSHEDDARLFADLWHKIAWALGLAVLLAWPFVASARWLTIGTQTLVAVVGAVALMILTGFAGQISLGHAAFLAIGAYTVAVLGHTVHMPFWLGIPIAGLLAAAVGLAIGPFALRLRGLYLALVTLGLIFIVAHVLLSFPDLTGGVSGISVPMHSWFSAPEGTSSLGDVTMPTRLGSLEIAFSTKLYFLYLGLAVAVCLAGVNLRRSHTGRAMMAVRDSDLAAEALGVSPARAKIMAFGISSFFAGVAGAMYAYEQQYITVEPPFDLHMSVHYIAMIVIGGVGTIFGAVAGAITLVMLSPLVESLTADLPLLSSLTSAQRSTMVFSVMVCGFLIFEPLGLLGIYLRLKRYFLTWPFRY